ncbi:MAG: hypothetical protein AAFX78_07950 [Cyanobacteria bacterium J06638_20]
MTFSGIFEEVRGVFAIAQAPKLPRWAIAMTGFRPGWSGVGDRWKRRITEYDSRFEALI